MAVKRIEHRNLMKVDPETLHETQVLGEECSKYLLSNADKCFPFYCNIVIEDHMDHVCRQLDKICSWCKESYKDSKWFVNEDMVFIDTTLGQSIIQIEFNFVSEEDLTAFKLRWK